MPSVKVPLGGRSYDIRIEAGCIDRLGLECRRLRLSTRCAIISDENVEPLFGLRAVNSLKKAGFNLVKIVLPAGEKTKNLKQVQRCYERLAEHRLERRSFIVALGGGVIGDLAGFVAATYLRGLAFIQIPTTLLAQVDSSVGGKVGVNLRFGKNLVGAFHQPQLVLCDLDCISSLPTREFLAGMAEVIKYGIIADAAFFKRLEKNLPAILRREPSILAAVISRCCQIKADVVGRDETETGLRGILNYGHTIGHALEAVSGYGKFLHGEAISIGQVAAARISAQLTGLSSPHVERIIQLFLNTGLPVRVRLTPTQMDRLVEVMKLDKKVEGGKVRFVLAHEISRVTLGHAVSRAKIVAALGK